MDQINIKRTLNIIDLFQRSHYYSASLHTRLKGKSSKCPVEHVIALTGVRGRTRTKKSSSWIFNSLVLAAFSCRFLFHELVTKTIWIFELHMGTCTLQIQLSLFQNGASVKKTVNCIEWFWSLFRRKDYNLCVGWKFV